MISSIVGQPPAPSPDGRPQFHLAIPSTDIEATAGFYQALGCQVGRRNQVALTLNFFGHQLVAHLVDEVAAQPGIYPRHFGVIVDADQLDLIEHRLDAGSFIVNRRVRFGGSDIEHETLLVRDPTGNQLEFKCYATNLGPLAPVADERIGDTDSGTD